MDLRKVIKFGKATYSITLPKEWVVEQELEKGDVVRVEQLPTGNLEVHPKEMEKEVEVKEIEIDAEGKDYEDIWREVVGAYIKNYTIINIIGDVKGKIKDLRKNLQELMGLEVMEVSSDKIVAKSFMDITETKVSQTIKRIFYIIKSMSDEFQECVEECTNIGEIEEMDREVNRNTFFIQKYLFKSLENPRLPKEDGMKKYQIFFTWELVKYLENIADKLKLMADLASNKEILLKEDSMNEFLEIYGKIETNFEQAMKQYFKQEKENIHEIFDKIKEYDEKCNEFLNAHSKAWAPLLVDHLKDINMFTKGIAEIIVDFK